MRRTKSYICLALLVLFISCKINGKLQGLYGYYSSAKKANPDLFIDNYDVESICNLRTNDDPKIYITNGNLLKKCILDAKSEAIIYLWGPKCKSKVCYPLEILQQSCKVKNIQFYIVSEYYDANLMAVNYDIDRPIFGIDTEYYGSNLTSKYVKSFITDLTSTNNVDYRFYNFQNGVFTKSYKTIERSISAISNGTKNSVNYDDKD